MLPSGNRPARNERALANSVGKPREFDPAACNLETQTGHDASRSQEDHLPDDVRDIEAVISTMRLLSEQLNNTATAIPSTRGEEKVTGNKLVPYSTRVSVTCLGSPLHCTRS